MSLMKEMLNAGVHYGHQKKFWNPKMKEFIFGTNHGIHIINLEKTIPLFKRSIKFVNKIILKGGKILFVGTKRQAKSIVQEEALRCGMPYVNHRWLGGMLTNYKTIRRSIKYLRNLEKLDSEGFFSQLLKKEALENQRKIEKLKKTLDGVKNMGGLPDALFVIDSKEEHLSIKEGKRLGIPIVAIVDSNSSIEDVDYIIPGNDDSIKSIRFYLSHFSNEIISAGEVYNQLKKNKKEEVTSISKT